MNYPKTLNKEKLFEFLKEMPLKMMVTKINENIIIIQKWEKQQ